MDKLVRFLIIILIIAAVAAAGIGLIYFISNML